MLPLFGDDRKRREINLGGTRSASSHEFILEQAKARRFEREDNRRKRDSAVRLQSWWRGLSEARRVRRQLRQTLAENVTGIVGLRCLVVIGQDEEALALWSNAILGAGEEALFQMGADSERFSWLVLIRPVTSLLLKSVARAPKSQNAVSHLRILNALLSPSVCTRHLGDQGPDVSREITRYLLARDMYSHLSQAITSIDLEAKSTPSLPLIVPLVTAPLATYLDVSPELYQKALSELFLYILTISLLPNRLPLVSLTEFSSRLPLANLPQLPATFPAQACALTTVQKVHLIANLTAFTPPRYKSLPAAALSAYLELLSTVMSSLPANALNPPPPRSSLSTSPWASDSDSDSDAPVQVRVVSSFSTAPREPLPQLDARTRKRLQTLPAAAHLNTLMAAAQRNPARLFAFLLSLSLVWPRRKDAVLGAAVAYAGGGLMRELWRGHVRGSVLGRDERAGAIMDPENAASWPPLLLLTEMYAQALQTMGDDEFFSGAASAGSARNPLTLDELIEFSRKLLNVAFTLYWREEQRDVQEGTVPGLSVPWEVVRERVTKCLQGIHDRDSRKPFTPEGHWHCTSQIDVSSFIEAAVLEEQRLTQPEGAQNRPLSKRQVAKLSPRLGVLHNIPFAIPFEIRVSIFRHFVVNDMISQGYDRFGRRGRLRVTVRRDHIAEDGFDRLGEADLKAPIEIVFIDQFGQEEAGIDGGGVFKEFLTSLCKEVFDRDRGLWLANKKNELYPNPHSYAKESHSLNWYRFIGRVLGKALYEGILVDVAFAGFFLAKWLGKQSFLDDLASLDPDLYNGLIFLKHYTGNPEDLSLTFTVDEEDLGVTKTTELIPNGSNIPVTRENRLQYITLVSHYRLSKQIRLQSEAFFEGLSQMIDTKWLRMFNQQELQILLGGVDTPIDFDDLRKHTNYGGLYDDDHETIVMFWNVVNTFNQDQRRALLRFVTSCSRPPLLGFKELVPNFAIRDAGSDENRLPTSSTCVNLLKLPRYQSEAVLRNKILQAIYAGAGFDLS
ncbi:HECT-domain-containing protein [Neolentinus lepideus HHB14362 ss-1]|uniref:HECT-type E3 ubiquitin transferase n=1 Tax=Neolentinus lepideus HHB14362 ss-1 TaxID=1314782 RepID=A0A165S3T5_9AGAM|nr:HECT-domain-containing protein [Neolentinus lepideus HHB14362 ss-1]